MAKARFKQDKLYVDDVDHSRLARELQKAFIALLNQSTDLSKLHKNDWLDIGAKLLGANNHHALRKEAKLNQMGQSGSDLALLLAQEAQEQGAPFPLYLPQEFDEAWRQKSTSLFSEAMSLFTAGKIEIIALVGASGTGKTLLAKNMVALHGGAVMDATLNPNRIYPQYAKQGAILVYDRPSVLPKPVQLDWTIEKAKDPVFMRQVMRSHYRLDGAYGHVHQVLETVREHPQCHVVISLPTVDMLQEALTWIRNPVKGFMFDAAHVVDLDNMTLTTVTPKLPETQSA